MDHYAGCQKKSETVERRQSKATLSENSDEGEDRGELDSTVGFGMGGELWVVAPDMGRLLPPTAFPLRICFRVLGHLAYMHAVISRRHNETSGWVDWEDEDSN